MYNEYKRYQAPSNKPSKPPRRGNDWPRAPFLYASSHNTTKPPPHFQARPNMSREFSEELQQRVQSHKKNMKNEGTETVKRKFDNLTKNPIPPISPSANASGNLGYRPVPPVHDASNTDSTKSNRVINTTVEESYWAQWKPQQGTVSNWTEPKAAKEPPSILKRSIAAFNRTLCGSNTPTNEKNPLLKSTQSSVKDEKLLKVIRKPMEMLESNSSEGDKIGPTKIFGYNRMLPEMNSAPPPPSRPFPTPPPTMIMSIPTYQSNYYNTVNNAIQCDERIRMDRQEPIHRNCRLPDIDDIKEDENDEMMCSPRSNTYASSKRSQSCDEKKRPKVEKKHVEKYKKDKQTKSDEELTECFRDCVRSRVRFCTRKQRCDENDSNDSDSTLRDSTRTIDGYHGDVDTESYNQAKDLCTYEFDESFEEGQGDLESESYENPREMPICEESYSLNSLLPNDAESFEDRHMYEQYQYYNNEARYFHAPYQHSSPLNNTISEEDITVSARSDSITSKIGHADNTTNYNMYMDHSQIYGNQSNYTRSEYQNNPHMVKSISGYDRVEAYPPPSVDAAAQVCYDSPSYKSICPPRYANSNNSTCSEKLCNSYGPSPKSSPSSVASEGKGSRMKVKSPREMDDISEKSYCTSKSNTVKDPIKNKSSCCVRKEEQEEKQQEERPELPPDTRIQIDCDSQTCFAKKQTDCNSQTCLAKKQTDCNSQTCLAKKQVDCDSQTCLAKRQIDCDSDTCVAKKQIDSDPHPSLSAKKQIDCDSQSTFAKKQISDVKVPDMEPYIRSSHDLQYSLHSNKVEFRSDISHISYRHAEEHDQSDESLSSPSNDVISHECTCQHNCDNLCEQKQSTSSSRSCHCQDSSNDDTVAVVESNKTIDEETDAQRDSSEYVSVDNPEESNDSFSLEVEQTIYTVHDIQTNFDLAKYDSTLPKEVNSMKVLHQNSHALRTRSSLTTDPSKTSQPAMILQLSPFSRNSRTTTSTRCSYNKGHTYTLKSPQRKAARSPTKPKR